MTLTTKLILIAALILSIIIPFGYYLIGERNRKKYKRSHRNECLFLLWRIRDYFHHDVCRPTGTGR